MAAPQEQIISDPIVLEGERQDDRGAIIVDRLVEFARGKMEKVFSDVLGLPYINSGNALAMEDLYGKGVGADVASVRLVLSQWFSQLRAGFDSVRVVPFDDRGAIVPRGYFPGTRNHRTIGIRPRFSGTPQMRVGFRVDPGVGEVVRPTSPRLSMMGIRDGENPLENLVNVLGESVEWTPRKRSDGPIVIPPGNFAVMDLAVFNREHLLEFMRNAGLPAVDVPAGEQVDEDHTYVCDFMAA